MKEVFEKILADAKVQKAKELMIKDDPKTWEQLQELVLIPAFSRFEEKRADRFQEMVEAEGFKTERDEVNNVYTTIKGSDPKAPTVFITAHLDTVFPMDTKLEIVEREPGKFYCPGIGDDTSNLAQVLTLLRAIRDSGLKFKGDLIIGGNVGEEGLGDLYGMKAFFGKKENLDKVDAYITMDGGPGSIGYLGTGSYRYKVTFKGPGGHSQGNFGMPNPIHAMGRAIAKFADMKPPTEPQTTFSVGVVNGGTSVNSIAIECSMLVDMRSNGKAELDAEDAQFHKILKEAVEEENGRWVRDRALYSDVFTRPGQAPWCDRKVELVVEKVGDRPVARQNADDPIVVAGLEAYKAAGVDVTLSGPGSGDFNVPISMGVPSVGVGGGGFGGGAHSKDEWYSPVDVGKGLFKILVMLCGYLGVDGVSDPLIPKKG
ncbi:MAG: M20/M25/M40 family metallo-hydrolase [Firmicutes bacterium]|nr:M20/M25/M40 family metallo-hydrolase [Bacillota bacterium]